MKALRFALISLLGCSVLAGGLSVHAQGTTYSSDQVTQMVAPIALYPDALMSQVLMASTYPTQVAESDQWVRANPGLKGSTLDSALSTATWDPSVIALAKFPTVLDRMAQNITWTTDLGNAFLYQRTDVMDAVQDLRSAAYQNGTLRTNEQERVVVEDQNIAIQPYQPEVIYVPVYQPSVVYGSYWNYPSYYYPAMWDPWPGYSFVNGFAWGFGYLFGNILFGGCDWGHHDVWMNYGAINNCSLYQNTPYYNNGCGGGDCNHQQWNHNSGGVDYNNGGTGQPYGGRSRGNINGVTAGHASRVGPTAAGTLGSGSRSTFSRTTKPPQTANATRDNTRMTQRDITANTARENTRTTQRGQAGITARDNARTTQRDMAANTARNTGRPTVNGTTNNAVRGAGRMTMNDPTSYTTRGANRPNTNGVPNYSLRGTNRSAVNGPANNAVRGTNRSTANGSTGYAGQNYNRPAQRGQAGNTARSYNRPSVNSAPNYAGRSVNRPSANMGSNYAARGGNRPSVSSAPNYSMRGANRPSASGPSSYGRSGGGQSFSRPSGSGGRASAPSGHAGGGRGASAGSHGGGHGGGGRR